MLTGDASLRRRPVRRVIEPLRRMGANLSARDGDRLPPVVVRGGALRGTRHVLEVASAQVKSAMPAGRAVRRGRDRRSTEPERSRDHTERMLRGMGVPVADGRAHRDGRPVAPARAAGSTCPGDISSAAFFLCARRGRARLGGDGPRPGRRTPPGPGSSTSSPPWARALTLANEREVAGEPRADVTVRAAELRGTEIRGAIIPRLIDELPVLMVLATQARGRTVIRDAKELRVKESDRLAAMGETLAAAGARIELFEDGCAIDGPTPLRGVAVRTRLDHRIAMSMAVAQLFAGGEEVLLDDVACVATSFPSFFDLLDASGGGTSVISGRTALYGVLGHPVDHSRSPAMQNAAFADGRRRRGLRGAAGRARAARGRGARGRTRSASRGSTSPCRTSRRRPPSAPRSTRSRPRSAR